MHPAWPPFSELLHHQCGGVCILSVVSPPSVSIVPLPDRELLIQVRVSFQSAAAALPQTGAVGDAVGCCSVLQPTCWTMFWITNKACALLIRVPTLFYFDDREDINV